MFRLFTIIALIICFVPTFAQTKKTVPKCELTSAPTLRGFYLGQTVQEINSVIPSFKSAYETEKQSNISSENKEVGWVFMSSTDFFYIETSGSTVARRVPSEDFEDTDFIWHFLDDKVCFLSVQYLKFEPPNLRSFINQVTEKTNLPKEGWRIEDKYHAELKCNGFQVYVSTGQDVGRPLYKTEPSVMLTDTVAEVELEKRRKEIQIKKKREEQERIRREREKKNIFKP